MRVWGLEYTIKINGKWLKKWTGPCGIYAMYCMDKPDIDFSIFEGRPFFFRTRKQARKEAKLQSYGTAKFRAIPFELTWRRL